MEDVTLTTTARRRRGAGDREVLEATDPVKETRWGASIAKAASILGRPRTMAVVLAVDVVWVVLNLTLRGAAFDPPPFAVLGRTSAALACLLLLLAWANGRRMGHKAQTGESASVHTRTNEHRERKR